MGFILWSVFNYWAELRTEENAEQLKSMEAVGIEWVRERKERSWNERQGEMKRKRRKSPGREKRLD